MLTDQEILQLFSEIAGPDKCRKFLESDNSNELDEFHIQIIIELETINDKYEPYIDIDCDYIPIYNTAKDDCKVCLSKNSLRMHPTKGLRICSNCDIVTNELLDEFAEWRHFESDGNDNSRCSYNSGYRYNQMNTLLNWVLVNHKERSINDAMLYITTQCTKADIPKCAIENIKCIYKDFIKGSSEDDLSTVQGLNRRDLLAAITIYVCKDKGIPRLPEEIIEMYTLNLQDITDGCRTFAELMKLKNKNYVMKNSTPEQYLVRLAPKLGVKRDFIELANRLARNIRLLGIASQHTPSSIAAASVLIAGQLKNIPIQNDSVSKVFRISPSTSEKIVTKMKEYIRVIIDNDKTDKLAELINKRKEQLTI